jgi:predicted metal-dependent hydrolase
MEHFIELAEKNIPYTLRLSSRAKRMRFTVSPGGVSVVTAPKITPQSFIERMLRTRAEWIIEKIEQLSKFAAPTPRLSTKEKKALYKTHKAAALALAERRAQHLNQHYGFSYQKISIRDQKTRWGSCSKKGNLSFSYKIALMPAYLADYIIVHELCHLGSFDHSATFWSLVARTVPNHKALRKELRQHARTVR